MTSIGFFGTEYKSYFRTSKSAQYLVKLVAQR